MNIHRLALLIILLCASSLCAGEKRHGPEAIEIKVSVGTADEEMKFVPNTFSFERGKYYKLVLHNPSSEDALLHLGCTFDTYLYQEGLKSRTSPARPSRKYTAPLTILSLNPAPPSNGFSIP